jgi:hypothetical protein
MRGQLAAQHGERRPRHRFGTVDLTLGRTEGCSAGLCAADEGKLNGVSVDSCLCAALPERFENRTLTDETAVAAHIDMDSERVEGSVAFYRCGGVRSMVA